MLSFLTNQCRQGELEKTLLTMSLLVPYDRRFVQGQSGSSGRFLPQQSSPVPSPYAPQSPATSYRQYPHPPAYSQHQHLQQGLKTHIGRFIENLFH